MYQIEPVMKTTRLIVWLHSFEWQLYNISIGCTSNDNEFRPLKVGYTNWNWLTHGFEWSEHVNSAWDSNVWIIKDMNLYWFDVRKLQNHSKEGIIFINDVPSLLKNLRQMTFLWDKRVPLGSKSLRHLANKRANVARSRV